MRPYLIVLVMVGALVGLALTSGCGGGSDGSTLAWGRYSPPADVIAPADLHTLAARSVVGIPTAAAGVAVGDFQVFAFGDIPALRNLLIELISVVGENLGGLGDLLPLQAQQQRTNRQLVNLMKQVVTAPALHTAQAGAVDPFFDWTDPQTNVHWTGRILEQEDGRLLPQLRGVGPETNCTVNLTLLFELGSRLQLSGSIQGPIVADVIRVATDESDWEVLPGRALVDASLKLNVNVIAGGDPNFNADTHLSGDFQVPAGGGWETLNQGDSRIVAEGNLGDAPALTVNGFIRRGVRLGPGLFWWRHDFQANLGLGDLGGLALAQEDEGGGGEVGGDEGGGDEGGDGGGDVGGDQGGDDGEVGSGGDGGAGDDGGSGGIGGDGGAGDWELYPPVYSAVGGENVVFSDTITFSDGMTGDLQVTANESGLTLSGTLRAADGTVLGTIDGGLSYDNPPIIHWADGSETELI